MTNQALNNSSKPQGNFGGVDRFRKIGTRIKYLAMFLYYIILVLFPLGVSIQTLLGSSPELVIITAPLSFVVGYLFAWLATFSLYGFGQLIESTQNIESSNQAIIEAINSQTAYLGKAIYRKAEAEDSGHRE